MQITKQNSKQQSSLKQRGRSRSVKQGPNSMKVASSDLLNFVSMLEINPKEDTDLPQLFSNNPKASFEQV